MPTAAGGAPGLFEPRKQEPMQHRKPASSTVDSKPASSKKSAASPKAAPNLQNVRPSE